MSSRTDSLTEDRVLEVVALPGHERDQHVAAERHLTVVGRRTVGEHVTLFHVLPLNLTLMRCDRHVPWLVRTNFCTR